MGEGIQGIGRKCRSTGEKGVVVNELKKMGEDYLGKAEKWEKKSEVSKARRSW